MTVAFIVLLLIQIVSSSNHRDEYDHVGEEFSLNNFVNQEELGKSSLFTSVAEYLSDVSISKECEYGLKLYLGAIEKLESWAIRMIDASSKIPSGILEGTVMDFGEFDECLAIRVKETLKNSKENELFRGRYCTLELQPLPKNRFEKSSDSRNYAEVYDISSGWVYKVVENLIRNRSKPFFWFSACVPSVCSDKDVQNILSVIAEPFGMNVSVSDCQVDDLYVWKSSTLAAICVLGILACLCGIGTLTDVIIRRQSALDSKQENSIILQVTKAFSTLTNMEKLFASDGGSGLFDCFNGIRFLSATWIILGHNYFYSITWKFISYRGVWRYYEYFNGNLLFAVIDNFSLAVSSFFFLSGFLFVNSTWKQLEASGGRINPFMFFVHKYWRIIPGILMLLALLFAMPIIDSGPLWNLVLDTPLQQCQKLWWINLLFIQNWWRLDELCMGHTWYLAVLMQLHIAGFLLLIITYRWSTAGILLSSLAMVACITGTAVDVVWNNLSMPSPSHRDIISNGNNGNFSDFAVRIYTKPFLHFPSYLVGMVAAFFVMKCRHRKLAVKHQILAWILSTVVALVCIYGSFEFANQVFARAVYISTRRIGWTMSLAWVTFACASGVGGIVNRILSFSAMRSLGQISFLAYLLHPLIIIYKTASTRERVYNGHTVLVFSYLSTTVVSFALAFIGYVTVEMPFAVLQKIIFLDQKSKPNTTKAVDHLQAFPKGEVKSS